MVADKALLRLSILKYTIPFLVLCFSLYQKSRRFFAWSIPWCSSSLCRPPRYTLCYASQSQFTPTYLASKPTLAGPTFPFHQFLRIHISQPAKTVETHKNSNSHQGLSTLAATRGRRLKSLVLCCNWNPTTSWRMVMMHCS